MFSLTSRRAASELSTEDTKPPVTKYIGLSGYARVGKDSVASILIDQDWKRFAFADKLKEAVFRLNPILDAPSRVQDALADLGPEKAKEQYDEYRRLLQVMGTEVGRDMFGENFWVDQALSQVEPGDCAVFTDCRFPNEAQAIRDLGGQVWRIHRPGYGPVNGHASETSLDDFDFDYEIYNDGTMADLAYAIKIGLDT